MDAKIIFVIFWLLRACAGDTWREFLGTVGDKEFSVVSEQLNVYEASVVCSEGSAKLAAVESQAESEFLKNVPGLINGEYYWTDGAGLFTFEDYSWDSIGKPVDHLLFRNGNVKIQITGVVLRVGPDYGTLHLKDALTSPMPQPVYPAICERRIPSLNLPQLTHIGSVGGKSFYIDQNQNFTWQESLDYCRGLGLQLAAIETAKEQQHIRNALPPSTVSAYWTSGRLHVSKYVWNESDKPINATVSFNPDEGTRGIVAPSWWNLHIDERHKALCQHLSYE